MNREPAEVGQKVGLRLTLTTHTAENLDQLFDLIEREGINRACFYHLVYSGRGGQIAGRITLAASRTKILGSALGSLTL